MTIHSLSGLHGLVKNIAWECVMPAASNNERLGAGTVSLSGVSVLVVEDSWPVAQALQSVLENCGMAVSGPTATIAAAQKLLAQTVPDMAVVDINLQGEMAYGLIDQLLERGVTVVVVTGYEVLPEIETKVAAILSKPIRAGALLAILRQIAAKRAGN